MVLEIDGLDITPYVAFQGVKWQRNDIDASDTTRMLDGSLQRSRVATKVRMDVTCKPLKLDEAAKVLSAIMPVFVTVRYTDPQAGSVVTKTMYANNNPATYCIKQPDGTEYWSGIEFPLIER